jgi:hypothetical protein
MFRWIRRTFDPQGRIGETWCSLMHDSARWPIHGHYECSICGRRYRVPWAPAEPSAAPQVRRAPLQVMLQLARRPQADRLS